MTCIVALVHEGTIHMACDSEISDNDSSVTMANPKIAVNGEYILGVSQSLRVLNILHHISLPPVPSLSNLRSFMCIEFVQAIASALDDMPGTSGQEKMEEGTEILVATLGKIFVIGEDYSVHEAEYPFSASGGGTLPALGSLFSTENLGPKARVIKAVKSASEFSPGVKGPVQYIKFNQPND